MNSSCGLQTAGEKIASSSGPDEAQLNSEAGLLW